MRAKHGDGTMGSLIEINDTLKLRIDQGMPERPVVAKQYKFRLPEKRLFHSPPTRVFLVQEIDGKWKYIGHAIIIKQIINSKDNTTSGVFEITKIYDEKYAKLATINEAPQGKSYY